MTIDKAIELLTLIRKTPYNFCDPDTLASLQLGIEALKRIRAMRAGYRDRETDLLKGEDERA